MSHPNASTAPDRVRIDDDVLIDGTGSRDLHCDIFHPPEPSVGRTAVLLIHGGAWAHGNRKQLRGYGVLLARRGYVCATVEYRLTGEAKWPAQLHDLKTALRFIRARSADLGIDPGKICVAGNSAGGHLALMLAGTADRPEFEGPGAYAGVSSACAACIAIYAPTKLFGPQRPHAYAPGLFAEGVGDAEAREASPIEYARRDFPPTLLIHGNRDEIVAPAASLSMYQALISHGAPAELHMYDGVPHGFDLQRDYGRQCVELMALFLDRHVRDPQTLRIAFGPRGEPSTSTWKV